MNGSLCQEVFLADKPSTGSDSLAPSWSRDVRQGEAHDEPTGDRKGLHLYCKTDRGRETSGTPKSSPEWTAVWMSPWDLQLAALKGTILGRGMRSECLPVEYTDYYCRYGLHVWQCRLEARVLRVYDIHTVPPGWTLGKHRALHGLFSCTPLFLTGLGLGH